VIELERHIEILLLSNDCVIVPDLGGFMTHHIDARYEEVDHTFLPPIRTLGFNPLLTMNDSLLVQSYVEAYDMSYPEAMRRIEDEVRELKQRLDNDGFYEFNGIGTLSLNEDGNLVFTPCEAGILTPELYGLSSFEMKPLQAAAAVRKPVAAEAEAPALMPMAPAPPESVMTLGDTPVVEEEPTIEEEATAAEETIAAEEPVADEEEEDDENAIVIKMSWIRNAVAVAAAVLAFILMTTPVSNSGDNPQNMSQLSGSVLFGVMPKDSNAEKIIIRKDTVSLLQPAPVVEDSTEAVKTDTIPATVAVPDTAPATTKPESSGYCVVLASYVTKKNADEYVTRLHKQGYEGAEVYVRNNVTRVVISGFETEGEAYSKMRSIQSREEFKDAWVLKIKDES